ncbi:MAG: hypothetical protein ACK551_00500 [Vampirovibrionales bacterium]
MPGANPMIFAVQKESRTIGPFQIPQFSNNKVSAKARVGANPVEFGGSVSTTAPVVNSMFLKNLSPQVGTAQNRLNIIA